MTDTAPTPPAPLVPADQRDALVLVVTTALVGELQADQARDADRLDRATRAALESVETHLDCTTTPYATPALVPARILAALIDLAAGECRRPGFAYGLAGYDEADPMAVRAYGAVMAMLTPGLKQRWGVA